MKIIKKWWFWVLVIIILYFLLGYVFKIVPSYQCFSGMRPEGTVRHCGWYRGTSVG